jgi:hypothetical protein
MASTLKTDVEVMLTEGVDSTSAFQLPSKGTWGYANNVQFRDGVISEQVQVRAAYIDATAVWGNLSPNPATAYPGYVIAYSPNKISFVHPTSGLTHTSRVLSGPWYQTGGGLVNTIEISGEWTTDLPTLNTIAVIRIVTSTTWQWETGDGYLMDGPFPIVPLVPQAVTGGLTIRFLSDPAVAGAYVAGDLWFLVDHGTSPFLDQTPTYPNLTNRWDWVKHSSGVFACNQSNPVVWIPGSNPRFLQNVLGTYAAGPPGVFTGKGPFTGGRYIECFYEHIVLANITECQDRATASSALALYPNRIKWSDVFNFTQFVASSTNEADFYDLSTSTSGSQSISDITGMRKIGPALFTYTRDEIWQTRYVGLPQVFLTSRLCTQRGNIFPYGLATDGNRHFFWYYDDCYMFDGGGAPTSIGQRVKNEFFSRLSSSQTLKDRTIASVNKYRNEVTWFFCSTSNVTGYPDQKVVYNWRDQTWYFGQAFDVRGALLDFDGVRQLSCAADRFYLDYRPDLGDSTSGLVTQTAFALGSRDIILSQDANQVEIDTIVVDCLSNQAVPVYFSQRNYITDLITYTYVGSVTKLEPELSLSLPRSRGRVFRFWFGGPPPAGLVGSPAPQPNVWSGSIFVGYIVKYRQFGAER